MDDGSSRVLTVPNLLSVLRLCCIPIFLWLLFGRDDRFGAALLLGGLGATDWVDGFIARRYNQVSELGKVLDPTADRLLLVTGIVAIMVDGSVPGLIAWPVVVREGLVAVVAVVIGLLGARRIDVTWVGKAGTFCNMFAFPLFLAGASDVFWRDQATLLGWAFGVVGVVLSWWAAAGYFPLARHALVEGRRARRDPAAGVGSADDHPPAPAGHVEDGAQR